MTPTTRIIAMITAAITLQACAWAYRPDVNQGNFLTAELVDQVEVGMSRDQVRDLLGYPVGHNPFRDERWDFIYQLDSKTAGNARSHVVVWFDGERVARIETRAALTR